MAYDLNESFDDTRRVFESELSKLQRKMQRGDNLSLEELRYEASLRLKLKEMDEMQAKHNEQGLKNRIHKFWKTITKK